MKKILPLLLALTGLVVGIGAGLTLRPSPAPVAEEAAGEETAEPEESAAGFVAVPFAGPFVVPVFRDGATVALVVISLAVEVEPEGAEEVRAAEPKLRDGFLKVMFRHANSGGFDGDFTTGPKMDDLRAALRKTLRTLLPLPPTGAVLVTEIARQES
ncbi:flagellar basal body-associated FliL family protein [Amaricoccus solimangrovi]|uniref:flagellar basal body-associated FliL family protein n=1 Tax=Amaricoccus solimangrovi TaxID=2589815 RepID=UPI0015E27079|nr:flagellar basal body-associated FliL family protein [Amaricoccus solimangrovi]